MAELKSKLNISKVSFDYLEGDAVEVTLEIENMSDQSAYSLNILFDVYDKQGNLLETCEEQFIWRGTLLPNECLTLKEIYFDFDQDKVYVPTIVSAR